MRNLFSEKRKGGGDEEDGDGNPPPIGTDPTKP